MRHTDKQLLGKGLKFLAGALPLIVIGPSITFSAFNNQSHSLYIPILLLGIAAMIAAIILMFKGINLIMKAVFG